MEENTIQVVDDVEVLYEGEHYVLKANRTTQEYELWNVKTGILELTGTVLPNMYMHMAMATQAMVEEKWRPALTGVQVAARTLALPTPKAN